MTEIREEDATLVAALGQVSIAFPVDSVFLVKRQEDGAFSLTETAAPSPFIKDYDLSSGPDEWSTQFDLTNWGLFMARDGDDLLGGIVIAFDTKHVDMLEGRNDLAVIWNIRIGPDARGQGIGTQLMRAAEDWASRKGCRELKVETQDINVRACRFYMKHGFRLREANSTAYPELPDETQLIWTKPLNERNAA